MHKGRKCLQTLESPCSVKIRYTALQGDRSIWCLANLFPPVSSPPALWLLMVTIDRRGCYFTPTQSLRLGGGPGYWCRCSSNDLSTPKWSIHEIMGSLRIQLLRNIDKYMCVQKQTTKCNYVSRASEHWHERISVYLFLQHFMKKKSLHDACKFIRDLFSSMP
jgi:hypothetical protein